MDLTSYTASDVSAYTSFFRSLAVPQLLDRSLKSLYRAHPTSAQECMMTLIDVLEANREWYYDLLVDQFEHTLQRLEEQGFGALGAAGVTLHFCVPLRDGGAFELFPGGADVEVSPNNYDAFAAMLGLYQRLPHAIASSRVYIDEVVHYLPVNARAHLLCDDYTAVLRFVEEHLLQPSSPWYIRERGVWDALDLTYAVPYRARLFPVRRDVNLNARVPWGDAAAYVTAARAKLRQLQQLNRDGVALNVAFATDAPHPHAYTTVARGGSSGNSASQPGGVADNNANHHNAMQHSGQDDGVEAAAMGDEERMFWQHLYAARDNPQTVPRNRMSFVLQLPGGQIALRENGQYITVTPQNIGQFVALAEARRADIHRAFACTGTAAAATDATTADCSDDKDAHTADDARQAQPQPSLPPPPPSSSSTAPLPQAQPPSALCASSTFERYPPEQSPSWNRVALTVEDMGNKFFASMRRLARRLAEGQLDEQEIAELQMNFYVPCRAGIYELIPNGRYINVTRHNAPEYFHRVEYEYERLRKTRDGHPAASSSSSNDNDHTYPDARGQSQQSQQQQQTPSRLTPKPPASAAAPAATTTGDAAGTGVVARHDTNAYLDESDMLFLGEFEAYTQSLLREGLSEQFIRSLNMKWCIVVPVKNYSVLLRPNGANVTVTPGEFQDYLRLALHTIREIRGAIAHTGRYPPVAVNSWSATPASATTTAAAATTTTTAAPATTTTTATVGNGNAAVHRAERAPDRDVVDDDDDAAAAAATTRALTREQAEIEKSAKLRDTAMPIPATAAERALFSPTHNFGGLFSPPQHLNL